MELLRASGYRRMPWKNGGGETFEIAVSPAQATLDSLDWRISMAIVAGDGPFSSFPGIDRTLSIVDGQGMELDLGAQLGRHALTTDTAPLHFPADIPVAARLLDGAIADLNVMTRRDRYRHVVRRLTLRGDLALDCTAAETAVFCCAGEITCTASGNTASLREKDCVLLRSSPQRLELSAATSSVALLIELHRTTL